jgi:uncharacterized membrane protein
MMLFKRPRVPEWSPIDDAEGWKAFTDLVGREVGARRWTVDFEAGWALGGENQFGLFNVAGKCGQAPREAWARIVAEHFTAVAATAARVGDEPGFESAGQARAAMKARLVTDEFLAGADVERVERRVADDLLLVVAYDLPETVMIPARADLLAYGTDEELMALALEHARAEPGLALSRYDIPGLRADDPEAPLYVLSGESFFTATHALWADGLYAPETEFGTLVGVPTRNIVLAHPIRDASAIGMVAPMVHLVQRYFHEGPGSLSESLYWLIDGRLERQDAWVDENGPAFAPSEGFTALLERLT